MYSMKAERGRTMIEYTTIDLATYPRKEHLELFMGMQSPHAGVTAEVDVTDLKSFVKKEGCSFYLAFTHVAALAADSIPQFRQRIHRLTSGGYEIREYAECPTSGTESYGNGMYCYCNLNHHMSWKEYIEKATELQQQARNAGSLDEGEDSEALLYITCVPWIHYADCMHPTDGVFDSNPRISWGKFEEDYRGRLMMPLTVVVHHGLVDGIQLGQFYGNVQKNMTALVEGRL